MPKALDIAYVVYQVTDLDRMEEFLRDFGLTTAERNPQALYMRGSGPAPYIHVTLAGDENRFIGAAFRMSSKEDLDVLALLPGSSAVEKLDAPGGGLRVRMTTPDQCRVDAVWGVADAPRLGYRAPNPFNAAEAKARRNVSLRAKREPCAAMRLGHFVLRVSSHDASLAWMRQRFGLVAADYMSVPGQPDKIIGTFLRCDRGAEYVDHHSLLLVEADEPGVHHCSFEVQDLDAIMGAHDYLRGRGYRLDCGVGRHLLGSQIFDYWRDPFGFRVEHYTDGDIVNSDHQPSTFSGTADQTTQWGANPPKEFFE